MAKPWISWAESLQMYQDYGIRNRIFLCILVCAFARATVQMLNIGFQMYHPQFHPTKNEIKLARLYFVVYGIFVLLITLFAYFYENGTILGILVTAYTYSITGIMLGIHIDDIHRILHR